MPPPTPLRSPLRRWLKILLLAWLGGIILDTPLFLLALSPNLRAAREFLPLVVFLTCFAWCILVSRAVHNVVYSRKHFYWLIPLLAVAFIIFLYPHATLVIAWARWSRNATPLLLPALAEALYASAMTAIPMTIVTSFLWLIARREFTPKYYYCIKCHYQLQGSLHAPRCPECGHFLEIGQDYPYLPQHIQALEKFQQEPSIEEESDDIPRHRERPNQT